MGTKILLAGILSSSFVLTGCGAISNIANEMQNNIQQQAEEQVNQLAQDALGNLLEETPTTSPSPTEQDATSSSKSTVASYTVPDSHYMISYSQTLNENSTLMGEGYIGWVNNECIADLTFQIPAQPSLLADPNDPLLGETPARTIRFVKNAATPAYVSTDAGETWSDSRGLAAPNPMLYTPTTVGYNGNINEQGLCSIPLWETFLDTDPTDANLFSWNNAAVEEYLTTSTNSWIAGLIPDFLKNVEMNSDELMRLFEDLAQGENVDTALNSATVALAVVDPVRITEAGEQKTYTMGGKLDANNEPTIIVSLTPTDPQTVQTPAGDLTVGTYEFLAIPGLEELAGVEGLEGLLNLNNLEDIQNLDLNSMFKLFSGGINEQGMQDLLNDLGVNADALVPSPTP